MKVIKPGFEILGSQKYDEMLTKIEMAGRTCYKSEALITKDSAEAFVRKIRDIGHDSVLEHDVISVRVICDRGVSHEIVRHRIAAYSQESTRYCNYSKEKFGEEITVIDPCFWKDNTILRTQWETAMKAAESHYMNLIRNGASAQEARSVLPNSLKTEIVITYNLREWRHFFRLRTSKKAHPQMREITIPMLAKFKELYPVFFEDINAEI